MGHEHATWGQLLKRCRLQQKVSIPAAAKCTGTTEDEWDFFELGEMWPDGQTRGRISRAFKGMRIHETLCVIASMQEAGR